MKPSFAVTVIALFTMPNENIVKLLALILPPIFNFCNSSGIGTSGITVTRSMNIVARCFSFKPPSIAVISAKLLAAVSQQISCLPVILMKNASQLKCHFGRKPMTYGLPSKILSNVALTGFFRSQIACSVKIASAYCQFELPFVIALTYANNVVTSKFKQSTFFTASKLLKKLQSVVSSFWSGIGRANSFWCDTTIPMSFNSSAKSSSIRWANSKITYKITIGMKKTIKIGLMNDWFIVPLVV